MSALAEKLRLLRGQAGIAAQVPSVGAALPEALRATMSAAAPASTSTPRIGGVPEELRRLLGIRARAGVSGLATLTRAHPADRELPGTELAPGLRLVERLLPFEGVPAIVELGFAKDNGPTPRGRLLHFDTETTGLACAS